MYERVEWTSAAKIDENIAKRKYWTEWYKGRLA